MREDIFVPWYEEEEFIQKEGRRKEMSEKPKYYITTAIAYTSGKPHIGNTYESVLADAIARYKRSQGYDVFFQTGTDEHGQKIELKAKEAGITPKEYVDQVAGEIHRIWDLMNTSYDKFIRTRREISTKGIMKGCIVPLVSLSLRSRSWWTGNVRTAGVKYSRRRKRHISSR